MQVSAVIFLVIISYLFLFSFHLAVYFFIRDFFGIESKKVKRALLGVLGFLALSFMVSAVLIRAFDGFLVKAFYIASAVWMGVLINLLVGITLAYLLVLVLKLFKINYIKKNIGIGILVLVVLLSFYGYYNAFNTEIKNIEVNIKDLPSEWVDKTIVHISDVHLGIIHNKGFLKKVVEKINKIEPEIVLITGDMFDGMDGFSFDILEPINSLVTKKGVYFTTGNHEFYLGNKPLSLIEEAGINILDNEIVNIDGLQVIGVNYDYNGDGKEFFGPESGYNDNMPSILMYHTPTNIMKPDNGESMHYNAYWSPDTRLGIVQANGVDLQLSGHTHKGQMFPFDILTKIIFKGLDYGLQVKDDFSIYISSGVGTWGPPMRTNSRSEIVAIKLKNKMECSDYSPDSCLASCVVCPPCPACSSISCQNPEFCADMGIDRSWYEDIKNRVDSFQKCVAAGNAVMESYPRQCRAGEQTFTENIGNELEKVDIITLNIPRPNSEIVSPLIIEGQARGTWFFEGDFPVVLTDWDGLIIAEGYATAQDDWMTEDFVQFKTELKFEKPEFNNKGLLILRKDNPSGLPENDDALEIPIFFK